jgi:hypothetical protein
MRKAAPATNERAALEALDRFTRCRLVRPLGPLGPLGVRAEFD